MINNVVALGYGIIIFAILVGVGSIVLYNFAGATGCNVADVWQPANNTCKNASNYYLTPGGASYTNTNYMLGQLGSSGLAGWTPAIIAVSVGLLFLGAFMIGNKDKRRY